MGSTTLAVAVICIGVTHLAHEAANFFKRPAPPPPAPGCGLAERCLERLEAVVEQRSAAFGPAAVGGAVLGGLVAIVLVLVCLARGLGLRVTVIGEFARPAVVEPAAVAAPATTPTPAPTVALALADSVDPLDELDLATYQPPPRRKRPAA